MHRIDRYIGSMVASAIVLVLVVIVGIDLLSVLIEEIKEIRGDYQFISVLTYIALVAPGSLYEYLPFAALVGCLAGLGMLASSSELVAMRAAGVSTGRLIWAIMRPTLLITLIGLAVAEFVAPVSQQIAESQRAVALQKSTSLNSKYGMWHREGNSFMHFNAVQANGVLYGVSVFEFDDDRRLTASTFAERASYLGDGWLLEDTRKITLTDEGALRTVHATEAWDSGLTPTLLNILVLDPDDLSISGLWQYANYLQRQGLNAGEYRLAFWNKLLQPLTIVGMVLVAISFIFGPLRDVTMGFRVFVGVMVGVVFRTLQDILGPSSLVYGFDPIYASLMPILICFVVGSALLMRRV